MLTSQLELDQPVRMLLACCVSAASEHEIGLPLKNPFLDSRRALILHSGEPLWFHSCTIL